jgi:hypothetical protein
MSAPVFDPTERRVKERRVNMAVDMSWDGNGYLSPVTGGWRECRRKAKRRKGDAVSTYSGLDDVCAGNPKAQEELAELRALRSKALCDRDHYQAMAEQRFAMRRELEELLGLEPDATYSEDQFKLALERLRKLVENEK